MQGNCLAINKLKIMKTFNLIICFENGEEKTFMDVIESSFNVGRFTKFELKNGKKIAVAHNKINWFEKIYNK